jgi:hypothetical protein
MRTPTGPLPHPLRWLRTSIQRPLRLSADRASRTTTCRCHATRGVSQISLLWVSQIRRFPHPRQLRLSLHQPRACAVPEVSTTAWTTTGLRRAGGRTPQARRRPPDTAMRLCKAQVSLLPILTDHTLVLFRCWMRRDSILHHSGACTVPRTVR